MKRLLNKPQAANTSSFNKADAFFNIDTVYPDGTKESLLGAPMYLSKEAQAWVIENADKLHLMKFDFSVHVVENKEKARALFEDDTTEQLKQAIAAA